MLLGISPLSVVSTCGAPYGGARHLGIDGAENVFGVQQEIKQQQLEKREEELLRRSEAERLQRNHQDLLRSLPLSMSTSPFSFTLLF